jgi:hypothetical protein
VVETMKDLPLIVDAYTTYKAHETATQVFSAPSEHRS